MTMTMNSTLLHPTLTPQPPLLPPITDHWVLLILPIVTYWSFSLVFHFLDTHDLLSKYRLHTPEEVLKRNHVTRREVVRDVILQQIIQTIVGGITALWEGVEMVGAEQLEVLKLYTRFLTVERWGLKALGLAGIDGLGLEEKIARGIVAAGGDELFLKTLQFLRLEGHKDWRWSVAEIVYWYIMPIVRLWIAIFILDTWQYFMHRAMHESKWLYSLSPASFPRIHADASRNISLPPPPLVRSVRFRRAL
jgi:sphinganine C4-monooxygenase